MRRCQIPATIPNPNPTNVSSGAVPQRSSSHLPAKPGKTISNPTAVIRPTHSIADVSGELPLELATFRGPPKLRGGPISLSPLSHGI
jgi:hypothetical protein